jgi:FkbM family methyltransferase
MGFWADKSGRVADIGTVLSNHAASPRSWLALVSAYASTLRSTTSKQEISFALRVKSRVYPFRMRRSDIFVLEEILLEGQYELRSPLPPKPIIVDAGANIGVTALWLLASYPDATLFAFEPEPENFRLLRANTNALDRVRIEHLALGASKSIATLHVASHGALHSIKAADAGETGTVPVECVRLADYMDDQRIDRIDLLKMDVEGSELDLLLGLGDRLDAVQVIVGEFHETLVDESRFYGLLEAHGFRRLRKEYYGRGRVDGVHVFEVAR